MFVDILVTGSQPHFLLSYYTIPCPVDRNSIATIKSDLTVLGLFHMLIHCFPCFAGSTVTETSTNILWMFFKHLLVLCTESTRVKVTQSCPTLCIPMDCRVQGILQARILEWVAFSFSRGSSQPRNWTQVPHCRRILYQLSHKGNPRILEWVAYPFSRGSSWPRNQTGVSGIAGRFFTSWAMSEARMRESTRKTRNMTSTYQ